MTDNLELNLEIIPDFDLPEFKEEEVTRTEVTDSSDEPIVLEETKTEVKEEEIVSDPKAIAFFEELKARGYTSDNVDFKGTWEELDAYFDTLPQQILDSVIQGYPEESRDVLKFIAAAGSNLNKQELKSFFETYFQEQEEKETALETNDSARSYLEKHYKSLGLKDKNVSIMLDQLEEDDEILEEAKKIFEEKTKESKVKNIIASKEKETSEQLTAQKEKARLIFEELNSTGWKKEKIERVTKILSNETLNSRLADVFGSPKAIVQLADLLDLYDTKTKQFDLTAYNNQTLTSATKSLKERLEKENFSSSSVSTKHVNTNPKEEWKILEPIV